MSLLRARTDDADVTLLGDFHLALRYRVLPDLQVGVTLGGAVARDGGYAGLFGDIRYSVMAERSWNPYVAGAVGFSFTEPGRAGLFLRGGVGIERRFTSWGFSAETHLSFIGGRDEVVVDVSEDELAHFGGWSGALTLSAHYHWGGSPRRRRYTP